MTTASGRFLRPLLLLGTALVLPCCTPDIGQGDSTSQVTLRVSVGPQGQQGNGESGSFSLSEDGRYVAFSSFAFNLSPNDANDTRDILVKDRETGRIENITNIATNLAVLHTGDALRPRLSASGRFVVFESSGQYDNTGGSWSTSTLSHPVRYDRVTGKFTQVVASSSAYLNDFLYGMCLSADGRYLAFMTGATNTGIATGGHQQVFLCDFGPDPDIPTTTLTLISHATSSPTTPANGNCSIGDQGISGDGELVVFESDATDGAAGDTDSGRDVYLWRRSTGVVTVISVPGPFGTAGMSPAVSQDGTTIAYVRVDFPLYPQPHYQNCEVVSLPGGQRRRVSEDGVKVNSVRLSRDGTKVVYAAEQGSLVRPTLYIEGWGRQLVTRSTSGELPTVSVGSAAISADGRWVAWSTEAPNMVAGDTNGFSDIFIRGPF